MKIIQKVLGNVHKDPDWATRLHGLTHDRLVLSPWEAQKSRCRKFTEGGLELGITLDRGHILENGDVLVWNEKQSHIVVVALNLPEVMVIHIDPLRANTTLMSTCFQLGHILGNQHWKALFKNDQVLIPLTVPYRMLESVLKSHGFDHYPHTCVRGESLINVLTQAEARLLFAGVEDLSHHVHVDIPSAAADRDRRV